MTFRARSMGSLRNAAANAAATEEHHGPTRCKDGSAQAQASFLDAGLRVQNEIDLLF